MYYLAPMRVLYLDIVAACLKPAPDAQRCQHERPAASGTVGSLSEDDCAPPNAKVKTSKSRRNDAAPMMSFTYTKLWLFASVAIATLHDGQGLTSEMLNSAQKSCLFAL